MSCKSFKHCPIPKTCKDCEVEKTPEHFYKTGGKVCIGCTLIRRYNNQHKPEDTTKTRDILVNKCLDKIIYHEAELKKIRARLQEFKI
jgi:hypothetical protein